MTKTIAGTPVDKAGTILSPAIWDALAHEYLRAVGDTHQDLVAVSNAQSLGDYVDLQVEGGERPHPNSGDSTFEYRHAGAWWCESRDPEPYADLDELARAWAVTTVFVSNQYCDHPVWSVRQNVKFRIWHDTHHVVTRNGFDPDGELRVFAHAAKELDGECWDDTGALIDALFCESVYQLAACLHLGGFPDRQAVRTPGRAGRRVLELLLEIA